MRFHVPPSPPWNPAKLQLELSALYVRASMDGDVVRVHQAPLECRDFPRLWRIKTFEPEIVVSYRSDRVLYNGTVDCELGKNPVDDDLRKVATALEACGYLLIDDGRIDLEFDIARKYCSNPQELMAHFNELRRLETIKSQLVSKQEFEAASVARTQQEQLRDQIDSLVRAQALR